MEVDLWLDESGDFIKDIERLEVPSLVGGVMVESGSISRKEAEELLIQAQRNVPALQNETKIHATEIKNDYGLFAIPLLQSIRDKNAQLIIFENEELVNIVNGDITYIHILSEGIIQLFQTLSLATDEEIHIHIYAARRVDVDEKRKTGHIKIISDEEYRLRLQEKLDLGYARRHIYPNNKQWNWTLELGSARTDPRLMLADVVCHSWFRREGRKFKEDESVKVKDTFDATYHFTALERSTISSIQRHISNGLIGDALYEWLLIDEEWRETYQQDKAGNTKESELLPTILRRLAQQPRFSQDLQLNILLSHIKTLILLERDFIKGRKILLATRDIIIPKMMETSLRHDHFFFQVNLMLFTNATHQGDLSLSDEQVKNCRYYIPTLSKRWKNFDILLDYFVREAVHFINIYHFDKAIEGMDQVKGFIENTIELFPIAFQDELHIETEVMNADILGKVLGTRLQAYIMHGRMDSQYLQLARVDSEQAMHQFHSESDLARQYQYRAMLECEAHEFTSSLKWLKKSVGVDPGYSLDELMEKVYEDGVMKQVFFFMHYTRLMAEASLYGESSLANNMYQTLVKYKMDTTLYESYRVQHPYQIIMWKLGTYLMSVGSTKSAMARYKQAIEIAESDKEAQTLLSIGLAIRAEEAYFLQKQDKKFEKDAKQSYKHLMQTFDQFNQSNLPVSLRSFFADWEQFFHENNQLNKGNSEKLYALSRKICY